jgi:hypothetical protein
MNTEGLIDHSNIDLWNSLNSIHEIEIRTGSQNGYSTYSIYNKSTIYVPENNFNSSYFTHELLHVLLRAKKVFISGALKQSIQDHQVLSKIFSKKLLEHIGNCLEHIKMLPHFLKLGYNVEYFIEDYSENKFTEEEILKLKALFITNESGKYIYNPSGVRLYIGKYFAIIACPNISIDYSKQLNELNNLDPELFQILKKFSDSWENYDYENDDPITGGYNDFLIEFITRLNEWTKGKIFLSLVE